MTEEKALGHSVWAKRQKAEENAHANMANSFKLSAHISGISMCGGLCDSSLRQAWACWRGSRKRPPCVSSINVVALMSVFLTCALQ